MVGGLPDQISLAALRREVLDVATRSRRMYARGGFMGLEPNVLQVLIAVSIDPGRTVGDLVEQLALGQSTVSRAMTLLEGRCLTHPENDPADRRRVRE